MAAEIMVCFVLAVLLCQKVLFFRFQRFHRRQLSAVCVFLQHFPGRLIERDFRLVFLTELLFILRAEILLVYGFISKVLSGVMDLFIDTFQVLLCLSEVFCIWVVTGKLADQSYKADSVYEKGTEVSVTFTKKSGKESDTEKGTGNSRQQSGGTSSGKDSPKTGDPSDIYPWMIAFFASLSAAGGIGFFQYRKKQYNKGN